MAIIEATLLADTILKGFEQSYRKFGQITQDSQHRFEQADWHGVQHASKQRITAYDSMISDLSLHLCYQLEQPDVSTEFWQSSKAHYSKLIKGHPQAEQAETFFNSIFSRLFRHRGISERHLFIKTSCQNTLHYDRNSLCHIVPVEQIISTCLLQLVDKFKFNLPWEDLDRDITLIRKQLQPFVKSCEFDSIELIKAVFYRNKAAYLIGRMRGKRDRPFVLSILNNEKGALYFDALLTDWDDISIIFGFARAYFMVNHPKPSQLVAYLHELMPHKPIYELWASLGILKHSKTEFYRQYIEHLENSDDQFVLAEGIKGMVMSVFTLPSADIVFKIIKDKFEPPKTVSKKIVKEKYQLVKEHDRVGRMADTQEFSNFSFPRARFSQELLDELLKVAPSIVELTDEQVIIKHLYTERRMIPLNMFLRKANEQQITKAIDEYGSAIKQLAAANIFPGDMLFKNFGMTRHGRVIFYDYDEIWYMSQCNFREIPKATTYEQAISDEPWYSVGEFDVFPQEFAHFMLGRKEVKKSFMKRHPELLDPAYWRKLQQNIATGTYASVLPYRRRQRLSRKSKRTMINAS
ncbi:bifunctional isocitrate dehydrogenase kinase/phosphatase [Psychrobium sp. 1_MG-2023]|uniref:bifunctional isocitrate dehydrogenase kinase/phosphatase n=1 Tax=Psychrobium sp. 1_MG-2023 TaxID=3062624 RepID=UPI000C32BD3E|nr:bifunctional isocitrate dehydrogenase kinase/phosphatase [Psychrobium sp. 1_MG-2023]MDP2559788.1 bifunctional isocitrate dehydrogenase kinase/phosphatase [Psychrobium sp. 1_MG-2023]PKF59104.1 bifunctional isocitrate dehydrogenase kinase/phosphatase [Alteromonadales bacterium alter-6D02]